MANHPSALKEARNSKKRHARNQGTLSLLKTLIKKMNTALASKKKDEANELLAQTVSVLDRAVSKGVVHRKTASRKASRLTLKVQKSLSA